MTFQSKTITTKCPEDEWNMYYSGSAVIHYKVTKDGIKVQGNMRRMETDPSFKKGVLELLEKHNPEQPEQQ